MTNAHTFRSLLKKTSLAVAMAAHNPLGARLVEEAGFDAVWGSGFELSASFGVPDASLITMSDQLEMTRRMVEAVGIPVIADFDTGFGNAVNVDHAVRRYAAAGIAALVIEDKTYPKDTSLREGGRQQLVRIEEFQGKIEAAVAAGGDDGIVVIARVEALIAGLGLDEAIARAAAYSEAGADMILIHSKSTTPDEIEAFVARWDGRRSIVVVPTAYPEFDEARAAETGKIGLVIYGNHGLRAAVAAMRATFKQIRADGGVAAADKRIATVKEIMELQGDAAMRKLEKRFLR